MYEYIMYEILKEIIQNYFQIAIKELHLILLLYLLRYICDFQFCLP